MVPAEVARLGKMLHLRLRPVVDIVLCWDAYSRVRELCWWAIMRWVDRGVTSLWGNGTRHLRVKAWVRDHSLGGQARGGNERLGHAHGHGDHVC